MTDKIGTSMPHRHNFVNDRHRHGRTIETAEIAHILSKDFDRDRRERIADTLESRQAARSIRAALAASRVVPPAVSIACEKHNAAPGVRCFGEEGTQTYGVCWARVKATAALR